MPYIIDGHNLIPKVPGLSLGAIDDEEQLIQVLQEFCRSQNKEVEVFFDNAPPGGMRVRKYGRVTAHFVRQGTTADEAIRRRLSRLGRSARNWTVVSSDRAVQANARAVHARVIASETFTSQMKRSVLKSANDPGESDSVKLNSDELDDWLDLFNADGEGS